MISSVPFSIFGFQAYAQGILRLEGEAIVLDWSTIDGWTWKKSPPRQVHIPLNHVDALEYKNSIFPMHVMLRLRVRNLEFLASIPGSDGAEIILYCRRRHRHHAQELANLVTLQLLEGVFTDKSSPASA